jgi:hypothetical protein
MSESPSRYSLRRSGLPIALACALAAALGGCSTFGWQDASCRSDNSWGTKVFGSVQRAEAESDMPPYSSEPRYDRRPPRQERVAMHEPETIEQSYPEESTRHLTDDTVPAAEATPEPTPEPFAEESPEPPAEESTEPPAEMTHEEPAEVGPEPPVAMTEPAPQVPSASPPPAAPSVEPPAAQAPKVAPQEKVARLPETVPPQPPPSPEVVKVCGADDTACQKQLTALLDDPLHKWIREKPTARDQSTGARLLAYRVLMPKLACDDLRHGRRETRAAHAETPAAEQPEAVQLLRRAVNLELKAEIDKRC